MNNNIALILAAGFSERYGSDKRIAGSTKPLIVQTLETICGCYDVVYLVHRYEDAKILSLLAPLLIPSRVQYVKAAKTNIGLGTSLASGVKQIISEHGVANINSVAIFLADMPYITEPTINTLKSQAKTQQILRPSYHGKLGHPVIFGQDFIQSLTLLTADNGASGVIKENLQSLLKIPVKDPGILKDIDFPADWDN